MENTATQAVVEKGWFQSISNTLRVDWLEEKMGLTQGKLVEFSLFFLMGMLIGYLTKKYSKLIFSFAAFILILVVLQQLNFISIDINWIKLSGLQPATASENVGFFAAYWEWIKMHMGAVLSGIVGLLVGFKIG